MTRSRSTSSARQPLRLWPGVALVAALWLARFGLKAAIPGFLGFGLGIFGGLVAALGAVVWWVFFSCAALGERWGGATLMVVALAATWALGHESMGPLWLAGYAVPVLLLVFVIWALLTRNFAGGTRRVSMVATILLASGWWLLVRTEGINGDHVADFRWRWNATAEERLLSHAKDPLVSAPVPAQGAKPGAAWPGFRGLHRDGVVSGVAIETDWEASPPLELWRRAVGPGWSSMAVGGDLLYTQEQRGDEEVVTSYRTATGEPVWMHADAVRFFESNAGAGPRATPTLAHGRVYTLGATGLLNALDAGDSTLLWQRDVVAASGASTPPWGFSSSPLVLDDLVVVQAGAVLAYDLDTGEPRCQGPATGGTFGTYSSPHRAVLSGVEQVLLLSGSGLIGVDPSDGALLWEHAMDAACT